MAKKIIKKEEEMDVKLPVKSLNLGDLWTLFRIVNADYNTVAGHRNKTAKGIISSRYREVKEELYSRVYGCDPFEIKEVVGEVEGSTPENVIEGLSQKRPQQMVQDAKESQNFVVRKNEAGGE